MYHHLTRNKKLMFSDFKDNKIKIMVKQIPFDPSKKELIKAKREINRLKKDFQ